MHRCDLNDLRDHQSELKKLEEEVFESLPRTCGNDTRQDVYEEVEEDREEALEKPLVCFKYCTLQYTPDRYVYITRYICGVRPSASSGIKKEPTPAEVPGRVQACRVCYMN